MSVLILLSKGISLQQSPMVEYQLHNCVVHFKMFRISAFVVFPRDPTPQDLRQKVSPTVTLKKVQRRALKEKKYLWSGCLLFLHNQPQFILHSLLPFITLIVDGHFSEETETHFTCIAIGLGRNDRIEHGECEYEICLNRLSFEIGTFGKYVPLCLLQKLLTA